MKTHKTFAVIETDARQTAAGQALLQKGFAVVGAEEIALADYVLLPLPMDEKQLKLVELLRACKKGAIAFGGKISQAVAEEAHQIGVELLDYYAREELAILNSIPTAEGCIALLLNEKKTTLWKTNILLTGFGRVASALANRLIALGANVTIYARSSSQRALAQSMGCSTVDTRNFEETCTHFDVFINTVPAMLFSREVLELMPKNSFIIDLASAPGGVDFPCADKLSHTAIHALGLPSKIAPFSAGAFVATTVLEILAERDEDE